MKQLLLIFFIVLAFFGCRQKQQYNQPGCEACVSKPPTHIMELAMSKDSAMIAQHTRVMFGDGEADYAFVLGENGLEYEAIYFTYTRDSVLFLVMGIILLSIFGIGFIIYMAERYEESKYKADAIEMDVKKAAMEYEQSKQTK